MEKYQIETYPMEMIFVVNSMAFSSILDPSLFC